MEAAIAKELSRFSELLTGNVPRARQALKKLLLDTVEFTPTTPETGKQTYAFRAELSYGAIVQGEVYLWRGVPKTSHVPCQEH